VPADVPDDPVALARALAAARGTGVDPSTVTGLVERVDALFAAHQGVILAVCRRSVGDPQRAAELAQETLLRGYQKLDSFRGESSFRTWLVGIARGECANAVRKRREVLTEDGVLDTADDEATVLSRLRRLEREALVRDAAEAVLTPEEQEVVHLRYVEHVPVEQIGALLGLREDSGARGVLQRVKRKLGRELRARLAALGHGSSFARDSG
jgi:RNA polymerase sigma-70 factor (ECF subfamily)